MLSPTRVCVASLIIGFALAGCEPEYKAYELAEVEDTAEAYALFLEQYPDGVNSTSAEERLDQIDWEAAKSEHSAGAYEEYLRQHPNGRFVTRAELEAPKQAWFDADMSSDPAAVEGFLKKYGAGAYGKNARERLDLLQRLPQHLEFGDAQLEVITEGKRWKITAEVKNVGEVPVIETNVRVAWKNADGKVARTKEWFLNCEPKEGIDAPAALTSPLNPGESRTFEFAFRQSEACDGWVADVQNMQLQVVEMKLAE